MAVKNPKRSTFKHQGRKYVTVKAVANRVEHSTTRVRLCKRAGKAHWFVSVTEHVGIKGKEDTVLTRCSDFWNALVRFDSECEDIGVIHEASQGNVEELIALSEDEKSEMARNVEARANA
ncbi:virion structural protein [Pseudomonas phage phi15]|uniref:Virion structural protein n=1 Tax=Pseudomonas phage phi15 TaxID=988656 RepID=F0V6W6_9CAUD|nr:virion structural protein [Pseudomonas phage phi15]CBZ41978.1 virion structural protein [Pseudomonas phage phi15]